MIRIDKGAMFRGFEQHLIKAAKQLQSELLNEAESGMQTPEGKNDLWTETISAASYIITATVVGGPWATVDEWGRGSLMDTRNPHLASYRMSGLWNPARKDLKIRSRPKGAYKDFFGRMRVARGPGGRDLEALPGYEPRPPSHALKTAVRWLENGRFQQVVQMAINSFPWHKYMVVTNTKRG